MTEVKKYPPSHKIYSSREGEKSCNFIVTQYIKDEVEKGWRLTVEFTLDNWKTKKSILLQDEELVDLYLVFSGKKKEMKAVRKDKGLRLENQGTHSYLEFQQGDKYSIKVSPYDGFIVIGMIVKILSFDLHVKNGRQDTYFMWDQTIIFMLQSVKEGIGEEIKVSNTSQQTTTSTTSTLKEIPYNFLDDGVHCTCCAKVMDVEKEAKVIDFSKKKLNRIVCLACQKS